MGLIALEEVERVFCRQAVEDLARTAKLPVDTDIVRFQDSIRIAARIFVEAKSHLGPPELRSAAKRLYGLNTRAEGGSDRAAQALARAVDAMPADLRQWLTSQNARHGRAIPTGAAILRPATRQRAIDRLRLILSPGGRAVAGRNRPGGRRSRSWEPLLRAPTIGRGRPSGSAEREYVQWLSAAYLEATGRLPPKTVHFDPDIRGPFGRLAHRCFELVGAPTGNLTRLVNQRAARPVRT